MADHQELEERLSYKFHDAGLLELALTHPSVAHEQGIALKTNQRLEFLGDAVLQLVLMAHDLAKPRLTCTALIQSAGGLCTR